MHLDRLEVHGFKSFRDKTVIEFPDNFTSIVGPNGSGKSNLTEAICFVLGKSRGLRVSNMQELIFNGGKKDKPAKRAVVKIKLSDNGTTYEIARLADIDGRSIYKLDGKRVPRQKIVDIVGDNEYNIILQDDVTRVIDMQPVERRGIIDELCGIAEYDKKKAKAMTELEKVEDKISDAHLILGEKEGYLTKLKKERDDAVKYQDLKNELEQNKASLLNHNIIVLEKRLEKHNEKKAELEKEKRGWQGEIEDIRKKIDKQRDDLKSTNRLIAELESDRTGSKISDIKSDIARIAERLSSMGERGKKAGDELGDKKESRGKLHGEEKECKGGIKRLSGEMEKLMGGIELESEKSSEPKLETDIDSLKGRIYKSESQTESLGSMIKRIESDIDALNDSRSDDDREIGRLEKNSKELEKRLGELREGHEQDNDKFSDLKSRNSALQSEIESLQESLEKTQIELTQKKTRLATIEEAGGGLKGAEKAIMKLKEVLQGIQGPVSQLGSVKKHEYELALRIAAGNRSHSIVVNDVNVAQKCIDYLRKKEVGRTTFLPLNRINVKCSDRPPKGAIGFAREFIQTDEKFARAFDYVFGDTVLVKDISAAKLIGIGEWRMVTLDGDLLEKSGAISGGFVRKDVEIFFSNLEDLEKEINALAKETEKLRESREEKIAERRENDVRLSRLGGKLADEKTEIERTELERGSLLRRVEELKRSSSDIEKKIEEFKNEISRNDSVIADAKKELGTDRSKLQELIAKRSKLDTTYLDELKDRHRELHVEKSKLEEKSSFLANQIAELDDEIAELEKETSELESGGKSLGDELNELKGELAGLERQGTTAIERVRSLMNKRSELDSSIIEAGAEIGKIEHDLQGINERMSQVLVEKTKVETELEALKKEFRKYEESPLVEKKVKELEGSIFRLEQRLEEFGPINMKAIETYDAVKKEYDEIVGKLETLKKERQSLFDFMENIEKRKHETFTKTFNVVKDNFRGIFAKLSGGEGTLILDNPANISESGLLINASPAGKKIMSLDSMSGGEKVLTTAAFLLAIQQYKPAYFYIVDELDAALDKQNSVKLGELLRDSETQFILVTHNNAMIKYADSVVGVSMRDGISQIVGVKLGQEETAA